MRYVNGTRLDDRIIRTDWDAGFVDGRQFGRGKSGGQVIAYWCINFFLKSLSSTDLLSMRLIRVVETRNYVGSSFSRAVFCAAIT